MAGVHSLGFEKSNGNGYPYIHLKLYGITIALYFDDDKLYVQTFRKASIRMLYLGSLISRCQNLAQLVVE